MMLFHQSFIIKGYFRFIIIRIICITIKIDAAIMGRGIIILNISTRSIILIKGVFMLLRVLKIFQKKIKRLQLGE